MEKLEQIRQEWNDTVKNWPKILISEEFGGAAAANNSSDLNESETDHQLVQPETVAKCLESCEKILTRDYMETPVWHEVSPTSPHGSLQKTPRSSPLPENGGSRVTYASDTDDKFIDCDISSSSNPSQKDEASQLKRYRAGTPIIDLDKDEKDILPDQTIDESDAIKSDSDQTEAINPSSVQFKDSAESNISLSEDSDTLNKTGSEATDSGVKLDNSSTMPDNNTSDKLEESKTSLVSPSGTTSSFETEFACNIVPAKPTAKDRKRSSLCHSLSDPVTGEPEDSILISSIANNPPDHMTTSQSQTEKLNCLSQPPPKSPHSSPALVPTTSTIAAGQSSHGKRRVTFYKTSAV